jgi:L,D-transpeptidase YbiS
MMTNGSLPPALLRACARQAVVPTRHILAVSIAAQTTSLFERNGARHVEWPRGAAPMAARVYRRIKTFRCSTSKFGIGETAGSNKTPRGLHRISEKIGGGWPVGTVFVGRKMAGFTWMGRPLAPITSRIFWLEGLEPGFNRGGNVDSNRRYIYIHGVGDETTLGRPDSLGCIHLAAEDLIPLYDKLPAATLVWIAER